MGGGEIAEKTGTEREIMTEEKGKGVAGGDVPGADQEKGREAIAIGGIEVIAMGIVIGTGMKERSRSRSRKKSKKEKKSDKEREEESSSRVESRGESKENRDKSDGPAKVTVISGVRGVSVKEEPK